MLLQALGMVHGDGVSNVLNHSQVQKSYAQQNIKIFTEPHAVIIMLTFNAG